MVKIPHFSFKKVSDKIERELSTNVIVNNPVTKEKKTYKAIWDTGATNSVITPKVFNDLNLTILEEVNVSGVNSLNHMAYLVSAGLFLPNKIGIKEVRFTVDEIAGTDVLIGMDIISQGDFSVSHGHNHTEFSFAMPSFDTPIDLEEKAHRINDKNRKYFPPQLKNVK